MIELRGRRGSIGVPTYIVLGSFRIAGIDPLHELVRAARAGDAGAVADVVERSRRAAPAIWPELEDGIVVPVPRHLPGAAHPLVVTVAESIAAERRWACATDALLRVRPAPEAKSGGLRDLTTEITTLDWVRPARGRAIVLVDDVVRSGTTLHACVAGIRAAGDQRKVVAIALAEALVG